MYLHLETLRKALATALFRRPFRLRRWALVLGFAGLFLLFWSFLALGQLLDNVLFPGWRRQPVRQPVFIVATPRSGTTFLQRLLSLDEARFKPLLLYEMIFAAVTWQRAIQGLAWLDRRLGEPGPRLVDAIGRFFFGDWDDRHFVRLDLPELLRPTPNEMRVTISSISASIFGRTSSTRASVRAALLPQAMSNPTPEIEMRSR